MPGAHRGTGTGTGSAGGGTHARSHLPWAVILGVVLVLVLAGGAAALVGLRSSPVADTPAASVAPAPGARPAAPGTAALQARLDEITGSAPLLFEGEQTALPPADVATLTRLAEALRADPAPGVVLTGHTAPIDGDPARCQLISQGRADAVAGWLVGAGVAPERLRAVGMSHSDSEHGETAAAARRVELRTL